MPIPTEGTQQCPICGNTTYDGWVSVEERLPEIPKGKFGVSVIVAVFDSVYEEINPGYGTDVQHMIYDGEGFKGLLIGSDCFDYTHTVDPVTHWMYEPDPPTK